MKLMEIIRCTDLSSEINIDRLFDLFISRRTNITDELNILVCGQIKDAALRQFYINKIQEVKDIIKGLPKKKRKRASLRQTLKREKRMTFIWIGVVLLLMDHCVK